MIIVPFGKPPVEEICNLGPPNRPALELDKCDLIQVPVIESNRGTAFRRSTAVGGYLDFCHSERSQTRKARRERRGTCFSTGEALLRSPKQVQSVSSVCYNSSEL